jgi:hypothetical protein
MKAKIQLSSVGRSCFDIDKEFDKVVAKLNDLGAELPLKPEAASDGQTSLFSEVERPAVKPYLES